MDRALLERMVGAAVLLLLLVVVAPAMLEGPRDSGSDSTEAPVNERATRVETIVLDVAPGSQTSAQEDAQAPAGASPPDPVVAPVAAAPAVKAQPAPPPVAGPAPQPVPKVIPKPKPAAKPPAEGGFIVQLGIFSSPDNADKFAARIRKRGFTVRQATLSGSQGELHRVYVGPRKTRGEAEDLAATMANSGYKGIVTSLDQGN